MLRPSVCGITLVSACLAVLRPDQPSHTSPDSTYQRAISEFRRGSFEKSLRLVRRAGPSRLRRPETEWDWKFRLLEADILLEQADAGRARALLETDSGDCRRYPAMEIRRRVLLAKLCVRERAPDFARARSLLDEARALASAERLPGAMAEVEVLRGQVLARRSLDEAEVAFQSARQAALKAGDLFQYGAASNNLGMVRQRRSRCDEAISYFDQALQVWHTLGADQVAAATANNLGLCYSELGNFDKALDYRQEAVRLVKPSPRLAEVLGETGRLYLVERQPREAIPYFRRALEASRRFNPPSDSARWANNLATALRESGDWGAAESATREALAMNPDPRSVPALQLNQAGIAAGRGRFEEAERIYRQTIASNPDNPSILWQAHAGLARVSLAAGDWDQAKESFETGIRIVEQSRSELNGPDNKITFLSRLIRFYQDYVDALMDRNLPLRALEVADSSRARILAEGLSRKRNPQLAVRGAGPLMALARRSRGTWLSYWVAPRRSFLWVVTGREIRALVLPPEKEIADAVERYRGFIEGAMRDPLRTESDAGRWLFDELIGKAQALLPLGPRVVVVPDGPLHQLNFETLPVYEGTPRYWIEDVVQAVAPSFGSFLGQQFHGGSTPGSLLILGDPESPGPEFPKLPYAHAEIANLTERFPSRATTVISGRSARPDAYAAAHPERFSMIHIAAHGEANHRSPLDSALILSPGERGFKLYARDVMDIPLNADLVTISACRSSGARTYAGEGPVGLARAFLQAGAGAVIAGLWDVSDYSTSVIMGRMYGQLARGATPAEALRQAKISFLRDSYSKPYYWGPFQFYTRRAVDF